MKTQILTIIPHTNACKCVSAYLCILTCKMTNVIGEIVLVGRSCDSQRLKETEKKGKLDIKIRYKVKKKDKNYAL